MLGNMAENGDKSKVRALLDANLKRVYEEALSEEVPDRFKTLLEQLKRKEQPK